MRFFVPEELWPLESIADELGADGLERDGAAPRARPVGRPPAARARRPGIRQFKLALRHEILGSSPFAPVAFGNQAPDSGSSEILALAGGDDRKP